MKPKVYVETSIISYLTARDSREVRERAKQEWTRDWRAKERGHYALYVAEPVIIEIERGDTRAAAKRLAAVDGLPSLPFTGDAERMADLLLQTRLIPKSAYMDAYHVGTAATHGMDYLVTWNCTHINNPRVLVRMAELIRGAGFVPPVITSPETLRSTKP